MKEDELEGQSILLSASQPHSIVSSVFQQFTEFITELVTFIFYGSGKLILGGHPSVLPIIYPQVLTFSQKNNKLVKLFLPSKIADRVFAGFNNLNEVDTVWVEETSLEKELILMRKRMTKEANFAIFVGGNTQSNSGNQPGIRYEYDSFIEHHPKGPAYLVGLAGGETLNIINCNNKTGRREPNTLSDKEIEILHSSNNTTLVTSILISDIKRNLTK
jgi:hypothetical protein